MMKLIQRGITIVGTILTIVNLLLVIGVIVFLVWCGKVATEFVEGWNTFGDTLVPGDLYYRAPTLTPYRIFLPAIGVLPTVPPLVTPVPTPKLAYPTEDEGLPMCRRFCTALESTKLHWHGSPMICECYYQFKGEWAWRIVWMDRKEKP